MKKLKDLVSGDKVIISGGGSSLQGDSVEEVEKLTKTQIVLKDMNTRYWIKNGNQMGGDRWSSSHLEIATKKKIAELTREKRRHSLNYTINKRLANIDLSKKTTEELEEIYKIVKGWMEK